MKVIVSFTAYEGENAMVQTTHTEDGVGLADVIALEQALVKTGLLDRLAAKLKQLD
jgi:hypothetical protein